METISMVDLAHSIFYSATNQIKEPEKEEVEKSESDGNLGYGWSVCANSNCNTVIEDDRTYCDECAFERDKLY